MLLHRFDGRFHSRSQFVMSEFKRGAASRKQQGLGSSAVHFVNPGQQFLRD